MFQIPFLITATKRGGLLSISGLLDSVSYQIENTPFIWKPDNDTWKPMSYTDWDPGQPDFCLSLESCLHFYSYPEFRWNDISCIVEGPYCSCGTGTCVSCAKSTWYKMLTNHSANNSTNNETWSSSTFLFFYVEDFRLLKLSIWTLRNSAYLCCVEHYSVY